MTGRLRRLDGIRRLEIRGIRYERHKLAHVRNSKGHISFLYGDDNSTSTFTTNTADVSKILPYSNRIVFNGGCGAGFGNFSQGIILDKIMIFSKPLDDDTMKALYLLGEHK